MYPPHVQRWMMWLGLAALAALLIQNAHEYVYLAQKPNPYEHGPGLPLLKEGPFDPTSAYMDLSLLPWTLDPASAWPEDLQREAQKPCGALAVLQQRYPLWLPKQTKDPLQQCERLRSKATADQGMALQGEILILETGESWDLALDPAQGLQMRRRSQP